MDIDITTIATPEQILAYFQTYNTITVGREYGTVVVFYKGYTFEITTTREDVRTYGRRAEVKLNKSFLLDSKRRDFTINALLLNYHELIDYNDGIKDLKNRTIRFIGQAEARIEEDYLRIFRYIRFVARFHSKLTIKTQIILENIENLKKLSVERIISEITNMCKYPNTNRAIALLNKYGITESLFGQQLPLLPNNIIKINEKLAYLFKDVLQNNCSIYKIIPLNKTVRAIAHMMIAPKNINISLFYFWKKFKNIDYLYYHCDFHGYYFLNPPSLPLKLNYKDIPIKNRASYTKQHYLKYFKTIVQNKI